MSGTARILVIDDHERTLSAIQRVLQKSGYQVTTALDGASGLHKALQEKPDLIILDIVMPGMNGYEVCRRLQESESTARIPLLMLTGLGRIDVEGKQQVLGIRQQVEGYDAGALEFLTKPIDSQTLLQKVKGLLWLGAR